MTGKIKTLIEAGKALLMARETYKEAFVLWHEDVELLPPDRFWELFEVYAKLFWKREDAKWAADEFARQALCKEGDYTLEEVASFAKNWAELVRALSKALWDKITEGYSDDSWSDFTDMLPHAGRKVCAMILDGKIGTVETLKDSFFEHHTEFQPHHTGKVRLGRDRMEIILHGEHYNQMMLRDAVASYITSWCGGQDETEAEPKLV